MFSWDLFIICIPWAKSRRGAASVRRSTRRHWRRDSSQSISGHKDGHLGIHVSAKGAVFMVTSKITWIPIGITRKTWSANFRGWWRCFDADFQVIWWSFLCVFLDVFVFFWWFDGDLCLFDGDLMFFDGDLLVVSLVISWWIDGDLMVIWWWFYGNWFIYENWRCHGKFMGYLDT